MREVVEAWEAAAASPEARAAIHPAGAAGDDAYDISGTAAAAWLATLLGPPPLDVLDFGAGDGRIARPLHALGYNVVAADASPAMLGRLFELDPDVPIWESDGSDPSVFPFPFDAVYALAVLIHHRHADAARIIETLAAVLRPSGRLILDLPIYEDGHEPETWISVSTWTLPELEELTTRIGVTVERAIVNPGTFVPGVDHDGLVILRRP